MSRVHHIEHEKQPLKGVRIVVTRARSQSRSFIDSIIELGGLPCEMPVIAIKKPEDPAVLAQISQALTHAEKYSWVIFTSVNGVNSFMDWLKVYGRELTVFSNARIAAVGPKTAEALKEYGLIVEQIPEHYHAEGLLELLEGLLHPGDTVLLPRGNLARQILPDTLNSNGILAEEITVYETIADVDHASAALSRLKQGDVDIITFASSSAVTYFMELLQKQGMEQAFIQQESIRLASIGPLTSQTIRSFGLQPAIEAEHSTMQHLLDAIVEHTIKVREDH